MKIITYTGGAGPDFISAGDAGSFEKGVPRELDDALADQLTVQFFFVEGASAAAAVAAAPAVQSKADSDKGAAAQGEV
jgi:hypothetical protein